MITAILADDEPMILRGLEKLIKSQKLGVSIIGTALDGKEALELIETHDPDMVISDINMPGFSGIQLLKTLKERESRTKLIFISGYQEFDYARDALKYGAVDYLIKPVNEKQLRSAIEKVAEMTSKDLQQAITLELHLDSDESDEIEKDLAKTREQMAGMEGYYCVLCCLDDNIQAYDEEERELIQFSTVNIIEELSEPIKGHWIISKNDVIYLLVYDEERAEVESMSISLPKQIIETVNSETGQSVSVSSSMIVETIAGLSEAFKQAKDRIGESYFYDDGSVLSYQDHHPRKYNLEDYYKAQVGILDGIRSYDYGKVQKAVSYYMEIVKDVSIWDKKTMVSYCMATLVFVEQHLASDTADIEKRDFDAFNHKMEATAGYVDAGELMTEMCKGLLKEMIVNANTQQNTDINKVKRYIHEHYSEPIKLETLADLVFMNPNYFSGYFKKHVGVKFKEYLTNYRINEAEKLILTTDYKVYEIAQAVGFGDYRHFSEVFKKVKGQTPRDYKKRVLG